MRFLHVLGRSRRSALAACALVAVPSIASTSGAQTPSPRDTLRRAEHDSAGVQPLPTVRVSITLRDQLLERVPWAVGVVGERELRRGQPTTGLDEALASIPGVLVGNRFNYALDQRITIRGFGSRANFGVRGVKILLDGIPQTLPDGQSQVTNVELATLQRVEVLRGSSSALYGNGSGGVIAFTTDMSSELPLDLRARLQAGAFGQLKWLARTAGRSNRTTAALSVSRFTWDGFRQYSTADVRQLNAGVDHALSAITTASPRLALADTPEASNPGALTAAEYAANPDSAAPFNVLRGADKRTTQHQLSLRVRREPGETGTSLDASAFALTRDVRNALAVAPPPPSGPANGTYSTLDREVFGARIAGSRNVAAALGGAAPPRLTLGIEWQRMQDLRENQRSTGGRPVEPTDTLLLSQLETVWSAGPFAQLSWEPTSRVLLSAGGRYDRVHFVVDDRFLSDGDASGKRTLPAWSGHVGASWTAHPAIAPYVNVSTSFETPTTTELQARPDASGGFNDALGPQRALTVEAGARGATRDGRVSWSAALFRTAVRDAIVQYLETGGRAYFTNAGETRNDGAELGLGIRAGDAMGVDVAYTWSNYRFTDYRIQRGAVVDTLDGNRLPGVPEHFLRVGLRTRPLAGATLDVDQTISSWVYADDGNMLRVEGWGPGITSARATWTGGGGGARVRPYVGVQNLFDRRYVATVVVNGFGGRVREPGQGRAWYAGAEVGVGAGTGTRR